jgi:putative nucleotidyltransferase with HDIG domain
MATTYRELGGGSDKPLEASKLVVGARLPFDIYIKDKGILKSLFSSGMVVSNSAIDVLREKGISEVYVKARDADIEDYLRKGKQQKDSRGSDPVAVHKKYSFHKDQHHQVDKLLLIPGSEIDFTLLSLDKFSLNLIVEASYRQPVRVPENVLEATGDIVVRQADVPRYNDYIKALLKADGVLKGKDMKRKALAIKENSKILIKDLLDNPRSGEKIKESQIMVSNMIDCILENKDTIYDLISLRGYDYYTYTHSVNVSALSIGIGVNIGLDKDRVEKLGMGALLHDIGKAVINPEILNKQGKLDQHEFMIIKSHVREGEKLLREHKDIPEEAFDAVVQHHEKLTGKGYPAGLTGKDTRLFGRISAIADCYDALTTRRPYKPAFSPFYALTLVAKETGDYDPDLLKEFVKMLGKIK